VAETVRCQPGVSPEPDAAVVAGRPIRVTSQQTESAMHIAHAYVLLELARTEQQHRTTTVRRYPRSTGRRASWWRRRGR
jgi:hypothetical protein